MIHATEMHSSVLVHRIAQVIEISLPLLRNGKDLFRDFSVFLGLKNKREKKKNYQDRVAGYNVFFYPTFILFYIVSVKKIQPNI